MRRYVHGFIVALAVLATGCAQTITDIDRTNDNKVKKSLFEGKWFMLNTVVDTPAQTRHTFIGLQGTHEMIEWDIQESKLIAYRVHEHIEGSEEFGARPGTTYRGAAVAIYPIQAHFDLKRSYSSATGEQSNMLTENMSDRHWYERDYIRVDWSNNLVADLGFQPDNFAVVPGGDIIHERQGCEEAGAEDCEPGALDIAEDHINITSRVMVAPLASWACFMPWGIAFEIDDNTMDCEAAEVKFRTSFMKVDEEREDAYQPFYYNDQHYAKFGFFRTDRFSYNPDYGVREPGRKDMANRWHIWQRSVDENGETIPYREREVRPLVFYLNAEFPRETALLDGNDRVEAGWDLVFRQAVAAAQDVPLDEVPQMFYICDNPVPEGAPEACGEPGTSPLLGDLRYPMIQYTDQPHLMSPLGYGPSSANPLSGRLFHATANIYGASLTTYAQYATDMVMLLNGDVTMDDYLGDYFDRVLSGESQNLTMHQAMDTTSLTKASFESNIERIQRQFSDAVRSGELSDDWGRGVRDAVRGTLRERDGLTEEMIHGLAGGTIAADDERVGQLSPVATMGQEWFAGDKARAKYREHNGCILAPEFDDDAVLIVAQRLARDPDLKNPDGTMNYDLVRARVKEEIYVGVLLHELGHTVGMAHNFGASNDPINYHDEYWDIRARGGSVEPFWSMNPQEREAAMAATNAEGHGLREFQYSSIMEYGRRWMSDVAGLGKYDAAAIKYAYGRTVEVWDHGRDVLPAAYEGLREKLQPHNYHYSMYPKIFAFGGNMNDADGAARFSQRKDVPMDEVGEGEGFTYSPDQEVYYRFCDNTHDGRFAWCRPFDEGADQWEQVAAVVNDYEGYYPFYNFRRNRLGFGVNLGGYINRIASRLRDVSAQYKHFVNEQIFIRGDRDCINPITGQPERANGRNLKPWESPVCGGEGYAASRLGFDLFARIMQQPDRGTYYWNGKLGVYEGMNLQPTADGIRSPDRPDLEDEPWWDFDRVIELYDAPAREHETTYSRDKYGYGFFYKPTQIGVWWDKYMALNEWIMPGENFAYVDERPELLKYQVNWSLLFPGEMLNIAGAAASQTYSAYAPVYDGENMIWRRFATASDEEKDAYADMDVIAPGDNFTVRFISVMMGSYWMPAVTMDKSFNQAFKIGVVGAQDAFDVPEEIRNDPDLYVEIEDPINHRIYYAVNTGVFSGDLGNYGGAPALSPGYTLLKKIRDEHYDENGDFHQENIDREIQDNLESAIEDATEELLNEANGTEACRRENESAQFRRDCNRARAEARRNGITEGTADAEAQARHTLRAQVHGDFFWPDTVRSWVYIFENR